MGLINGQPLQPLGKVDPNLQPLEKYTFRKGFSEARAKSSTLKSFQLVKFHNNLILL